MFVYEKQVNSIHTILKYDNYHDFMDRYGAVLKSSSQKQLKEVLKINNSWPELFNFQNSFNCQRENIPLTDKGNTMIYSIALTH